MEEPKRYGTMSISMELTLGMDFVWNPRKVYEFQT